MKRIPLTQGKFALVSVCDYKHLSQWKWYYMKTKIDGYAVRVGPRPEQRRISMANVVAARKGCAGKVDHKNRNRLDNRRPNLRPATSAQNAANARMLSSNTSGFKGVCYAKQNNQWVARIGIDGRHKHLGYFPLTKAGKIQAAYAYSVAADCRFKNFACYESVAHLLDAKTKRRIKKDVLTRLKTLAA